MIKCNIIFSSSSSTTSCCSVSASQLWLCAFLTRWWFTPLVMLQFKLLYDFYLFIFSCQLIICLEDLKIGLKYAEMKEKEVRWWVTWRTTVLERSAISSSTFISFSGTLCFDKVVPYKLCVTWMEFDIKSGYCFYCSEYFK